MRMRRRGTEYEGVPELVPPGQSIPEKQPRGLANQGQGNQVVPPSHDYDYDSIMLSPLDGRAVHVNVSGTATSLTLLKPTDTNLDTIGRVYPGGVGDENNTQWEVPVPVRMADVPNIRVRLHILIPTSLQVPPGGSGGSGGNPSGYFEPLANGDPASPEIVFLDGDVVMVFKDWPV